MHNSTSLKRHLTAYPVGKIEQTATRTIFFIAGFITSSLAALVPLVKTNSGIGNGMLGGLLLLLGFGAISVMPFTGPLTSRCGCKKPVIFSVSLMIILLPLISFCSDLITLFIFAFMFGVAIGATDSVMNIQAVIVNRQSKKPLMSGFHGFYSVGGIAGAGFMSFLLYLRLEPHFASLLVSALVALLLSFNISGILKFANEKEGRTFAFPHGIVLVLGAICFITFLTEGSVLDWSAVFLTEYKQLPEALGGLGFACFAALMTVGRLLGDRVIERIGVIKVVFAGALVAFAGLALTLYSSMWVFALIGYGLIGLGCSNIVPAMFACVGQQNVMPQSIAVPAMSTIGYAGVLAGPALVGFVANLSSLPIAFMILGLMLLTVAAVSKSLHI